VADPAQPPTAQPLVLVDYGTGGVATVTLNRPDQLNALTVELRRQTVAAIATLRDDVGAVVLTGAGRAFCAGVDLKELGGETAPTGGEAATIEAPAHLDIVGAIRACPVPVVAAVNGVAITGGFELVLACDLIIASSAARFADTHAQVGILPTWGITQRLPRLIGLARAKELSFTGRFIDAETAERWGLVNRVTGPEELLEVSRSVAADIVGADGPAVRALKAIYDDTADGTFADGLRQETAVSRQFMRHVTPADIAARRAAVQAKGRARSS